MKSLVSIVALATAVIAAPVRAQEAPPAAPSAPAPKGAPKLIVTVSVDQFSADLFAEYRTHATGGFARLLKGAVFPSGYQSHAATETCPGHSTILTGYRPEHTGIIANNWVDQATPRADKTVYCAEDESVPGSTSQNYTVSDKHLKVPTLGERMKVEVVGSLLHLPQVLFLDEPTIGLDVTMQKRIRSFIAEYNRRYGATILLTSHYMADVQALCKRVIVIHHGKILFDGALTTLGERFGSIKLIEAVLADGERIRLEVPKAETSQVTARLLAEHEVHDLTVEDPPIEDVIAQVFAAEAT